MGLLNLCLFEYQQLLYEEATTKYAGTWEQVFCELFELSGVNNTHRKIFKMQCRMQIEACKVKHLYTLRGRTEQFSFYF